MPTYVYRTREARNCACADFGYRVEQSMADEPLTKCPACGGAVYRAIQRPKLNLRKLKRDVHGSHDYREDLARFRGDPEAYVDGERALRRLKDKRKREGWELSRDFAPLYDGTAGSATGDLDDEEGEKIKHQAYEAARAEGFSLDSPVVKEFLSDMDEE
ncbi:MAG: hypothetical protein ACE5D3_00040 [Candidatus Binatia bacterium]